MNKFFRILRKTETIITVISMIAFTIVVFFAGLFPGVFKKSSGMVRGSLPLSVYLVHDAGSDLSGGGKRSLSGGFSGFKAAGSSAANHNRLVLFADGGFFITYYLLWL